jgi:cysteinyl-tRNA synthetase
MLNRLLRALPKQMAVQDVQVLRNAAAVFRELAGVLGLVRCDPAVAVAAARTKILAGLDLGEEEILALIARRNQARAAKDWATSDQVRDHLLAHRIVLKDTPEGTTWEVRK